MCGLVFDLCSGAATTAYSFGSYLFNCERPQPQQIQPIPEESIEYKICTVVGTLIKEAVFNEATHQAATFLARDVLHLKSQMWAGFDYGLCRAAYSAAECVTPSWFLAQNAPLLNLGYKGMILLLDLKLAYDLARDPNITWNRAVNITIHGLSNMVQLNTIGSIILKPYLA